MMEKTVYLIHGYRTRNGGQDDVGRMSPYFAEAGLRVKILDYGFLDEFQTFMCNDNLAKALARTLIPDSLVVAFSNGGALVHRMAEQGAVFDRVCLVNPALDKDKTIARANLIHTWYSPSDMATGVAKFIPFVRWGDQGRVGYAGSNPVHLSFNADRKFQARTGHGGVFDFDYSRRTIANMLLAGV